MTANTAQGELIEKGWAALPKEYRIPERAPTLEEARAWCQHLAETHYENFRVASRFLPKRLRQMVDRELAIDLDVFSRGGLEILNAIEQQDYNVLRARPAISKGKKVALLLRALSGKFFGRSAA